MERLRRLVAGEMEAATLEHNELAELTELAAHLERQLGVVAQRMSEINWVRDNDSPDKMTCCYDCGDIMPTPERGADYICNDCDPKAKLQRAIDHDFRN